ncbi:MAG: ATP-binding protein [Acidimicrobiia bacterium]|nr:ATP-binding protein [Acidimicrobiia bacterium]MDH5520084.1 ATP-binding protein [Acidimicrobiia bacterium]
MGTHRRFGSLRFRLTALATIVVAIVLTVTAAALVNVQRRQLTANLDASLEQRADTITAELAEELPDEPFATNDEDRAVQLVDGQGSILATSTNLIGEAALPNPLGPNDAEMFLTRDDLPLEDDTYRVLTRRVDTRAGEAFLHVTENIDDLNGALNKLTTTLLVTVPLVMALLALVIWWLTGRTLGPVDTIRSQVDAISATNSQNRVDVPSRDDEITRLAVTMNRMLDRLDNAARQQRRFVADAAHELRTPLTRIRTDVEVDLSQPDNADPGATNAAVRDEVIELQSLIDDLLHLARSDAGRPLAAHRPVDLDDIVLAEVRQQRTITDIDIDTSGVSAAHLKGHGDQLARATRNLLSNAVRHANTGVAVTLHERADAIELAIADDGPGVPTEHRDRIFERFARIDGARTRNDGGTGLGLAITKDIIEYHGGTIAYDPSWTSGARFVITLPKQPA